VKSCFPKGKREIAAPEALFAERLSGRVYLRRTDEELRLNALLAALHSEG